MILIGNSDCIQDVMLRGFKVYNYSSMIEGMGRLHLMPPIVDQSAPEFNFDLYYANWLLSDPMAFRDLMMIMYDVYSGFDVFLCSASMEIMGFINESFIKFIQQIYGVNCYWVNTVEDIDYCRTINSGFSIEGLGNFDMDKERLSEVAMESKQQSNSIAGYEFIMGGLHEDAEFGPVAKR